jgi:hypothetical protein
LFPTPSLRRIGALSTMCALLILAACGGGGDSNLEIGVIIAGQPVAGGSIQPGATRTITISAGQSLELDASEPVDWTLEVGGTVVAAGATVYYGGVSFTVTSVSSSRMVLDTIAPYPLAAPVSVSLTAVSTVDSAVVASADVVVIN